MRRVHSLSFITAPHNILILGLFFIIWPPINSAKAADISNQANVNTKLIVSSQLVEQEESFFAKGLRSYISSDYSSAYANWLKSANGGNAKAMFNIGKMWLDGLIPNQTSDLAKARIHFNQAAEKGYLPANDFLSLDTSELQSNQQTKLQVSLKTEEAQKAHQLVNAWLDEFDGNQWVIQIFASRDIEAVKSIIAKDRISSRSHILQENIKGVTWYKLIYGQYSSRELALKGRQKLPDRLNMHKPWLRKVSTLR